MNQAEMPPWSASVAIHEIPETGHRVDLVADAATRAAVASLANVKSLPRLQASFDVTRHGRDGLRVVGRVGATVEQICVVTLEPLTSEIDEPVDLVFMPQATAESADGAGARSQRMASDEGPEPLVDGSVDLGAIATEFLILAIDPYPRREGATFEAPSASAGDADHPFAALAALKNPGGRDGS